MGADLSRMRLNPLLDYAGVELKQGGVLLDADANELTGILDRRLRALASDILGRATVSSTTPDAFRIGLSGGMPMIGPGRLYVDGLLAENHGRPDPSGRRFDPLLAEPAFTDPVPYDQQPHLPFPPALPVPTPGSGRHLVYLDAWTREITHLERPDLVEPAVGVEASSRLQTVWQVRVAPEGLGPDATCATPDADLPGWPAIIAPSTGVLTTGTFEVPPEDDPCELPPTGGYRGLENQLYRVEVHDPGQPGGGATFKWSRENASVGSRVTSMVSATELELATLGRDDVLSLKTGDWVEILDDARELSRRPGEMRRIIVDEATRRVEFAPDLPADLLPAAFPDSTFPAERNLRVRRWDQSGRIFRTDASGTPVEVQDLDAAGSPGVIDMPDAATTLLLEHGVTVRFDSTGAAGLRTGDFWVFAARTADASVELLDRAPPRGVHHHYARLALWDVAAGTLTDCRNPWPPETGGHDCSCSACVTPQSHASGQLTIQDAVDAVRETGGTVCIGPGQYALAEPVRLDGVRAVRIRGQGPATLIATPGGAFALRDCEAVAIEDLAVLSLADLPAIGVETALGLTLRRLLLFVAPDRDRRSAAISLGGVVAGATIAENAILAETGILANDPSLPREDESFLLTAGLRIVDNALWCSRMAIALDEGAYRLLDTRIAGNDVLACAENAISATGFGLPGSALTVSRNPLAVAGPGLRLSGEGLLVEGNQLVRRGEEGAPDGIVLVPGAGRIGAARAQILSNQIVGFGGTGILVDGPVRDLIVKLNILERCGQGIRVMGSPDDGAASIENNHLRDIGARGAPDVGGIVVAGGGSATLAGNTLLRVGREMVEAGYHAGILASGLDRARILGNEAVGIGPPQGLRGVGFGLHLLGPVADFEVDHNRIERDLGPPADRDDALWTALQAEEVPPETGVIRAGAIVSVRLDRRQVVTLADARPKLTSVAADGSRGMVLGNVLIARGAAPAVEMTVTELQFSNNRVEARDNFREAVTLRTSVAIVCANRVIGGERSMFVSAAKPESAAVLGNIVSLGFDFPSAALPTPRWSELNLRS